MSAPAEIRPSTSVRPPWASGSPSRRRPARPKATAVKRAKPCQPRVLDRANTYRQQGPGAIRAAGSGVGRDLQVAAPVTLPDLGLADHAAACSSTSIPPAGGNPRGGAALPERGRGGGTASSFFSFFHCHRSFPRPRPCSHRADRRLSSSSSSASSLPPLACLFFGGFHASCPGRWPRQGRSSRGAAVLLGQVLGDPDERPGHHPTGKTALRQNGPVGCERVAWRGNIRPVCSAMSGNVQPT